MTIDYHLFIDKYSFFVNKCCNDNEPIFLSNDGEVKLVAISSSYFEKKLQALEAQTLVLEAYASLLSNKKTLSLDESKALIDKLISQE